MLILPKDIISHRSKQTDFLSRIPKVKVHLISYGTVKYKDKSQSDSGQKQKDFRRDQDQYIYAKQQFLHRQVTLLLFHIFVL